MLPENTPTPGMLRPNPTEPEVEPISPQAAETILHEAIAPYLAEGWRVLHRDAYWARLRRDTRNLDVWVDLLGEVQTRERGLTPLQESGRLMAWTVLLAMLLVALALSAALGLL